jgi:arsenite methyltransferase
MTVDAQAADSTRGDEEPFATWLLRHRHGGDPATRELILATLVPVRDQILENAQIAPGDTVLDVGCGDGMVSFAALDRVGPTGRVVFSDQSAELLAECQALAAASGGAERCDFQQAELPELTSIPSSSVDAVLTRSVVMYVAAKEESLAAMFRVLRPGGRISLYEPISRVLLSEPPEECYGYDVSDCIQAAAKVKAAYIGPSADANPLINFDERDLLMYAERAGFSEITLDLNVQTRVTLPNVVHDWETFLRMSPNPTAPPLGEVFGEVLGADELLLVEQCIRPQLDRGTLRMRYAVAFLQGTKPS